MDYPIQPIAKKLSLQTRIGWHTFRSTYSIILKDRVEDVKVVQELLRNAFTKVTLDIFAQAVTPAIRGKRRFESANSSFGQNLRSENDLERILRHKNVETTRQAYIQIRDAAMDAAMEQLATKVGPLFETTIEKAKRVN